MTLTSRVVRDARRRGVKVYSRRAWRCPNPAIYGWRRKFKPHALCPEHPADTLWQHISVTHGTNIKYDMRVLHRIGMDRFNSGVSYNFAIDMETGEVGLGQALDAKGTHTINNKNIPGYSRDQNAVSHAICFIGMPGDVPSRKAIVAAGKLMAAMVSKKALTKNFDYNPHRMVAWKDCPTDAVVNVMYDILRVMRAELA